MTFAEEVAKENSETIVATMPRRAVIVDSHTPIKRRARLISFLLRRQLWQRLRMVDGSVAYERVPS